MNMRDECVAVCVLILIVPVLSTSKNIRWTLEKTAGVRFTNHYAETTAVSGVSCAYICLWTGRCFVANYNSGSMACTMIEDASTFVIDEAWDSFFVVSGILFYLFVYTSLLLILYLENKKLNNGS